MSAPPSNTSDGQEPELREDERWEWGVQHDQGIRVETSQRNAEAAVDWMMPAFERNWRDTVKPHVVRRRVSDWAPLEAQL